MGFPCYFEEVRKLFFFNILGKWHHKNFVFKIKCSFADLRETPGQPQVASPLSSPQHPCYADSTAARAGILPQEMGRALQPQITGNTKQQASDYKSPHQMWWYPGSTNVDNSMHCMSWAPQVAPSGTTSMEHCHGALALRQRHVDSHLSRNGWDVPYHTHFKDPVPVR